MSNREDALSMADIIDSEDFGDQKASAMLRDYAALLARVEQALSEYDDGTKDNESVGAAMASILRGTHD